MFQKSWDRETKKYAKLNGTEKKQPVMIVYKKSILEKQSFSDLKMGRGSSICNKMHQQIGTIQE